MASTEKTLVYITGLTNGILYHFYVRATDGLGNYIESDSLAVMPTLNSVPRFGRPASAFKKRIRKTVWPGCIEQSKRCQPSTGRLQRLL